MNRQEQILEILARGPATHHEIAYELCMRFGNVKHALIRLGDKGLVHVSGWGLTRTRKRVVPLWAIGIGEPQPDRAAVYPSILNLMR